MSGAGIRGEAVEGIRGTEIRRPQIDCRAGGERKGKDSVVASVILGGTGFGGCQVQDRS